MFSSSSTRTARTEPALCAHSCSWASPLWPQDTRLCRSRRPKSSCTWPMPSSETWSDQQQTVLPGSSAAPIASSFCSFSCNSFGEEIQTCNLSSVLTLEVKSKGCRTKTGTKKLGWAAHSALGRCSGRGLFRDHALFLKA